MITDQTSSGRKDIRLWIYGLIVLAILSVSCREERRETGARPAAEPPAMKAAFDFRGRVVFQSDMDGDSEIYLLTAKTLVKLTDNSWQDEYPRWSPDGRRIAFTANPDGRFQVHTMNADGTDVVRETNAPHDAIEHAWSADGSRIAYTEDVPRGIGRSYALWELDLKTRRNERVLPGFPGSNALPDFSPAEPLLAFTGKRLMGWDVFILDLRTLIWKPLVEGGHSCRPRFSPDGRSLVYVSSEADRRGDVWMMNPDGSGKTRLTERDETWDYFPSWSPDGKYVVFCSDTQGRLQRGRWSLHLVKVGSRLVFPLFRSGGRDLFPDWR